MDEAGGGRGGQVGMNYVLGKGKNSMTKGKIGMGSLQAVKSK